MKQTKKLLSLVMALAMVLSLLPLAAVPAGALEPVDGIYQIGSADDLKAFRDLVNGTGTYAGNGNPAANAALAEESRTCGDSLTWTLDGGTLTITGTGEMKDYDYSNNGRAPWYESRNNITTVVIQSGATTIGDYAFNGCVNLTNVTIPDSVKTLGSYAFYGCAGLTSVTIPSGVETLDTYAFHECTGLAGMTIPASVKTINVGVFDTCTHLESVTFAPGSQLSTLGHDAFDECASLTDITIPSGVTTLYEDTFDDCTSLVSITITSDVTSSEAGIFDHDEKLEHIYCSQTTWDTIKNNLGSDTLPSDSPFITVTADPAAGGTVTGTGAHKAGSAVTLTATPGDDYAFVSWMENDTVVGTEATYTIPEGWTVNHTLTAKFIPAYPLWVGGVQVSDANRDKLSDNHWSYDPSTHTLTLSGFTYSGMGYNYTGSYYAGSYYAGIYYNGTDALTITLSGANSVTQTMSWGDSGDCPVVIDSSAKLTVTGSGSLTVQQGDKWNYGPAILSSGPITFSGGTVNAVGAYYNGVKAPSVTVKNGITSVDIKGQGDSAKAVDGTLKNEMGGVGYNQWNQATKIAANTSGAALSYQHVVFPIATYTLTFDANGGSGSMDNVTVEEGDSYVLPDCGFEPPADKKFIKWDVHGVDLIGIPGTPVVITSGCLDENGVVPLKAIWIDADKESVPKAAVKTEPKAEDLTYSGQGQALVTAGEAEGGAIWYAIGENATDVPDSGWSKDIPKGTNAGSYYVWYKAAGDAAHRDSEADCVTVKIEKANSVPATVTANNRTYDGTEKPLVTVDNSTLVGSTMQYALGTATEATEPYTTSIPTKTDAGTYYVWYMVKGDANHNDTEAAYVTATIAARPASSTHHTTTYKVNLPGDLDNGTLTANPQNAAKGRTVTLTAAPDEGYRADAVTVTDKDGKAVALTDNGDGTYTFSMPASPVEVAAVFVPVERPFVDVPEDAWFYEAVYYCYDHDLFKGIDAAHFDPTGTMTRAMFATVLYRMAGEPPVTGENPFTDVENGTWYTDPVIWAASEKIIEGYGDGLFGTNDPVTREQIAAILYRYAQSKGQGFVGSWMFPLDYPDAGEVSAWADEAMHWMVMNGVITGNPDGTLAPKATATRAEVATMLMRFEGLG